MNMTKTFCKKLFVMAGVITMWTAINPDVLSAQTSGVGCDGVTRFLWRTTDSKIALWRVDANLDNPSSVQYAADVVVRLGVSRPTPNH